MKTEFKSSFIKDVKKLKVKSVKELIPKVIENCERAKTIAEISHCEPLKSRGKYFKLKYGNYGFGVHIDKGTVTFIKFGTRENFYSDFPPF